MIAFMEKMKAVHYILAAVLMMELAPLSALAEDETGVKNVRFEVSGELVRIYYDLLGPVDRIHKVALVLHRESDPKFAYRPVYLSGDVGSIVFPGEKRRITWDFLKDFPDGVKGDDFYFTVEAEIIPTGGISPLVWIGGGAALVGGVVAILLMSKSEPIPPVPPDAFPAPPGRPK